MTFVRKFRIFKSYMKKERNGIIFILKHVITLNFSILTNYFVSVFIVSRDNFSPRNPILNHSDHKFRKYRHTKLWASTVKLIFQYLILSPDSCSFLCIAQKLFVQFSWNLGHIYLKLLRIDLRVNIYRLQFLNLKRIFFFFLLFSRIHFI